MESKPDSNQKAIVAALRQAGFSVCILSAAGHGGVPGVPDLLVGGVLRDDLPFGWSEGMRMNWLMEVKAPGGKLSPAQIHWHATWRGQVAIVRSVDDALRVVGVLPQKADKS